MRSALILALAAALLGCTTAATENPHSAPAADPNRIAGKVLETIDASNYTYIRLAAAAGEVWAAVPQTHVEVGAQVAIENPQGMADFESKALGRTFETIYFGTLEGQRTNGATARDDAADGPIDVAKADGTAGRTIAELYAEKGELSGKTVALRGKVVKYNAGIMGRNWLHLQDGSGDAAAGTHDVTVTSSGKAAVGDVVLVRGVVAVDKDFGAGYRYAVIVEDATLE